MQANHSSISSTCLRLEHLSSTLCKTYHSQRTVFCSLQHNQCVINAVNALTTSAGVTLKKLLPAISSSTKDCSQKMQSVANNSSKLVYITCQCKTDEQLVQVPSIAFCHVHSTSHYSYSTSISKSQRLQDIFYLFLQIFFQNTTHTLPKLLSTLLKMCHASVCFWALSELDKSL